MLHENNLLLKCRVYPWASRRSGHRAFTLIELLVVIAILSLLVSLLLPSLVRAKELARQGVCMANQRGLGVISHVFATEYNGFFPMGYRWNQWFMRSMTAIRLHEPYNGEDWYLRRDCNGTGGPYRDEDQVVTRGSWTAPIWRAHGTSMRRYEQYGLTDKAVVCPSWQGRQVHAYANPGVPGERIDGWGGRRLYSSYLIVSGLECTNPANSRYSNPGSAPGAETKYAWLTRSDMPAPAVGLEDANLSARIIACDRISGHLTNPGAVPEFNHAGRSGSRIPGFQAMVRGDGHVDSHVDGYYKDAPYQWGHSLATSHEIFVWW